MNYRTVVLAVKLNRSRLVLVLETDIYIYDISNMKLIHVINSTPKNKDGRTIRSCGRRRRSAQPWCSTVCLTPISPNRRLRSCQLPRRGRHVQQGYVPCPGPMSSGPLQWPRRPLISTHALLSRRTGCHNLLAYPGSDSRGEIYIYDTVNLVGVGPVERGPCPWWRTRADLGLVLAPGTPATPALQRSQPPLPQPPRTAAR